jgi:hypothetical protein
MCSYGGDITTQVFYTSRSAVRRDVDDQEAGTDGSMCTCIPLALGKQHFKSMLTSYLFGSHSRYPVSKTLP